MKECKNAAMFLSLRILEFLHLVMNKIRGSLLFYLNAAFKNYQNQYP
jgi:hypothetical protein